MLANFARSSACALALVAGCSAEDLGYPRVASASQSPDLRYTVEIRNHPTIDPPEQSLWIGETNGQLRYVAGVASDTGWSGPCAWSQDSSLFAFVVGAKVVVVEPTTGAVRLEQWLIHREDHVSRSRNEIRYIGFAQDSSAVVAQICTRQKLTCLEPTAIPVPAPGTGV